MLRRPEQTAMLERMAATPDMRQRIALFEQWFIQAVQQRTALDADVIQAVALIERSQGNLPIEHLAQTLNLSRRHLARKFAVHVGLSPKRLARLVRLRRR
jgi:transcriptional regulator GlxA family with amidase domain